MLQPLLIYTNFYKLQTLCYKLYRERDYLMKVYVIMR